MKKRLLSLLLAVAMMVAVVPTAAFARTETGTVNSDLRINANGVPYKAGDEDQNQNNQSVLGTGWYYSSSSSLSTLYLGVDRTNNELSSSASRFDFSLGDSLSSNCVIVLYNATLSNTTAKAKVIADSAGVSVTNCVLAYLSITTNKGASATVKNCIFPNSSYATYGNPTLDDWNIFAKDPGTTTGHKHTIHVTNGGKIKKLKIDNTDSTEVAMDAANLYVVGTSNFYDNLKLTLDDGTVRTVTPDDLSGGGCDLPKHIPLTITEDGIPDISKMTQGLFGYFYSDDWTYDSSSTPENHFPIHLLSNFSGPVGPYPVKLKVNNEGTITDGIFLNEVSGNGKITGGIFLQKPSNTDVYTIAAGEDRILTELTLGDKTVALDANTTALYVVGTPSSDLTVTVKNAYSNTYNFVIPAGSLISNLTLDNLLHIGTKELKFGADGIPNTSGTYCYYHPSTPEDKTYFGANWRYFSKSNMLYLDADNFDLGSTLITVNVNGSLTGGIIAKGATLYTLGTVKNVVVYGTLLTSSQAHIENCILLNPPEYRIGKSPSIQDCIIVNNPGNWRKTAITATDGAKITTIQLGDLTMTLDEPVSEIYFLPGDNSTPPENLTVTLDDGTEYEDIDLTQPVITLAPTKRDDPTTYYSVTVEGGEARNERGDILDSEVALTAGEKITLKLLDETQGEMAFSHWDVNNGDTALADELAKTGFDKMAHETTFTMPAHNLTLTAKYRMPEEDAPQDDSFLMTAAAVTGGAVLTGLVVWQGYNIISQVYLNAHLPEGTAIPTNRQQLALLLWNTAGQPEASAASYVFPDVADPDVQTAARWATEQGLFKARKDGTFAPTDSVTTGQVYRAWQKVK